MKYDFEIEWESPAVFKKPNDEGLLPARCSNTCLTARKSKHVKGSFHDNRLLVCTYTNVFNLVRPILATTRSGLRGICTREQFCANIRPHGVAELRDAHHFILGRAVDVRCRLGFATPAIGVGRLARCALSAHLELLRPSTQRAL